MTRRMFKHESTLQIFNQVGDQDLKLVGGSRGKLVRTEESYFRNTDGLSLSPLQTPHTCPSQGRPVSYSLSWVTALLIRPDKEECFTPYYYIFKGFYLKLLSIPNMGLKLTTLRSRVASSSLTEPARYTKRVFLWGKWWASRGKQSWEEGLVNQQKLMQGKTGTQWNKSSSGVMK